MPGTTEGASAPETATTTAAPATPPAQTPAQEAKDDHNPPWLAARLERERKAVLSGLGVQSEADAKSALAAYKAAQEAAKSEAQRAAERIAALEVQASQLAQANAVIAQRAARELTGLTDAQRQAVLGIAGEDAGKQLLAIDHLKPTWAASAPAAPPPPPPLPAPAQTVPHSPPPPPAAPPSPTNWLSQYKSLDAAGDYVRAAVILATHPEIASDLHK